MKKPTRLFLYCISTFAILISSFSTYAKIDSVSFNNSSLSFEDAVNLRFEHPDNSLKALEQFYVNAEKNGDTIMAIRSLMKLASAYGHQARYKESYDRLWAALLLADAPHMELAKSSIYRAIGRHYSFYNRKENALKFLELSLALKKQLVEKKIVEKAMLVENYYAFSATYRELNEPELSRIYLDSSFLYHDPSITNTDEAFLKFGQAVLLNHDKKYTEALEIFREIIPRFEKNNPSSQVLVYNYLGDTYRDLDNFEESERCYKKSLEISKIYHSHIDFTPLVHERLADLYYTHGYPEKAYQSLNTAKKLDALFFDSRSDYNQSLLEIQDAFRQEKEAQARLIQQQRLAQLEQEEKVMLLEKIMLVGFIVFLIFFGGLYFKHVSAKYQSEKELMRQKREFEVQQANEIVELKNKELAASTLKLIEKETFIHNLKDQLSQGKKDLKREEVKEIVRSISNSNTTNWKEFEARFVAVNKHFYEKLNSRFPNLTQGDLRVCALVKLNFCSKEIAKLLGISVESVHTTRYRLRKKLNLTRATNLTEFIANI